MADAAAMGRLIAMALHSGISLVEITVSFAASPATERWAGARTRSSPSRASSASPSSPYNHDKQGVQQNLISGSPDAPELVPVPVTSVQVNGDAQQEFGGSEESQASMGSCPDWGSQLEYAGGGGKCHVCGFSECG